MKILFLSRWFPYPPDNGSRIRIYNLLKSLSARHDVTLISFTEEQVPKAHLQEMRQYCERVDTVLYRPFKPTGPRAVLGFLSKQPRSVLDTFNFEMRALVRQTVAIQEFDVAIASQMDMAPYLNSLPNTPKILEEIELTTLYEQFSLAKSMPKKLRSRIMWWKWSNYVIDMLQKMDACTVVSAGEKERILDLVPDYGRVVVIPNGVDTTINAPEWGDPVADTLIYSGALTYGANFDAVDFFLRDIFPLILEKRPNVKLSVTGKLDGVPIEKLPKNDNVNFTGFLDDIRPAVAQSWVNVVPLRLGGGTRLKVLESMALGTPVVSTSKGAEGLNVEAGQDLLVVDKPEDFAASVLSILEKESLRKRLSHSGREAVVSKYDWGIIGGELNTLLYSVVENHQKETINAIR